MNQIEGFLNIVRVISITKPKNKNKNKKNGIDFFYGLICKLNFDLLSYF